MNKSCKIRELKNGLEIRVEQKGYWRIAAVVAASFFLCGLGAAAFFHKAALVAPAALISVLVLLAGLAGRSARLQVTKVELSGVLPPRGRSGSGVFRLNTAEVRWLEYRDADAFGIRGASGLYAVKSTGAKRVLPLVDFHEAGMIIQAIENKFPGLAEMWRSNLKAGATPEGNGTAHEPKR